MKKTIKTDPNLIYYSKIDKLFNIKTYNNSMIRFNINIQWAKRYIRLLDIGEIYQYCNFYLIKVYDKNPLVGFYYVGNYAYSKIGCSLYTLLEVFLFVIKFFNPKNYIIK